MTFTSDWTRPVPVTALMIHAQNTKNPIGDASTVYTTNPRADGTYSIQVPENGQYRIAVSPIEVIDATDPENLKLAQYPNSVDRIYTVDVNGNTNNVDITYTIR